jgi:peptidoglycan/LPS O-acetylase OafA/YrhL
MSMLSRLQLGDEKYPALTGVRALGASVVFFDHFPPWQDAHLTVNVMAFFFALSGFLIFRIYYERANLGRDFLAKYFLNRWARIYPVYFLLLTLAVCVQQEFRPWVLIQNYTLTHALFHPSALVIQPSWSLTAEECFYCLAPLLMILARRRGPIAVFLLGGVLLALALVIAQLPTHFLHTSDFVLSTTFFGHFLEFFAGAYLALQVVATETRGPIAIPGSRWTTEGLAAVVVVVIAMLVVYAHRPLHNGLVILLNNFLMPVPIAILYWGLLRENTWLSRLLSGKLACLLGRSSYSFYLLHALVIDSFSVPFLLPRLGSRLACVILTFAFTWAAAILLFLCYEEPLNRFIRRTGTATLFRSLNPLPR